MKYHVTHFFWEGKHYYRLGDVDVIHSSYRDIFKGELLADGQPVVFPVAYPTKQEYFSVEQAVTLWERVIHKQFVKEYIRNERPNPLRMEMPDRLVPEEDLQNPNSIARFHADLAAVTGISDDFSVSRFYNTIYGEMVTVVALEIAETLELGEFGPCPKVGFSWQGLAPYSYGVPEEMWHLGPCKVHKGEAGQRVLRWAYEHEAELRADHIYPSKKSDWSRDDEISIYFKGSRPSWKHKYTGYLEAPNLQELARQFNEFVASEIASLEVYLIAHQCPLCCGTGEVVPGSVSLDPLYLAAVKAVQMLKHNTRKATIEEAILAVGRLERYMHRK